MKWYLNVFRTDLQRWDGMYHESFADAVALMRKCEAYGDKRFQLYLKCVD